MNGRTVDLSYVVSHCESVAYDHKLLAHKAGPKPHKRDLRNEHLAKAQVADEIATFFRDEGEAKEPVQEIEDLARQINPETYTAYDSLVQRLLGEGADEGYAARVAEATYGSDLSDARQQASESIANAIGADPAESGYDKGLADAIAWHESQASTAERMESIEKTSERKGKYRQRANRHRLYAKRMKEDLEAARSLERERRRIEEERKEPLLPFTRQPAAQGRAEEEGIPLEVQRMFMRKGEVMDDEGFV